MIDSTGAGANAGVCPPAAATPFAEARPDGGVMDPWWSLAFHAIHTIATEAFPRDRRVWQHIGVEAQDVDCDEIPGRRYLLNDRASAASGRREPVVRQ
jgi:hypothetical protein